MVGDPGHVLPQARTRLLLVCIIYVFCLPCAIVAEVEALVTDFKGKVLKKILAALEVLDYNICWDILDCKDHGVPQSRRRWFCVGILATIRICFDQF